MFRYEGIECSLIRLIYSCQAIYSFCNYLAPVEYHRLLWHPATLNKEQDMTGVQKRPREAGEAFAKNAVSEFIKTQPASRGRFCTPGC